jgi:hypothetical protein
MAENVQPTQNRTDDYVVRHRNPLARDYVMVSQVVLVGYPTLSDGARLTYMVIYGHDWYEAGRGARKGYAYPTVARLARLRHATDRTVQRHLAELIAAGLLTRELRLGKPSLLYIEEPSPTETERYLHQRNSRGDNSGGGGVTGMSPHKADEPKQMKAVNGVVHNVQEKERRSTSQLKPISALLKIRTLPQHDRGRRDWVAQEVVSLTGDAESLGCYRLIADRCPQDLVFEALALLKEARREGSIRQSRGALFVGIVRRLCQERQLADPLPSSDAVQSREFG